MQEFLRKLKSIHTLKRHGIAPELVDQQFSILDQIGDRNFLLAHFVRDFVDKVRNLEQNKEFFINQKEKEKILQQKDIERKCEALYEQNIDELLLLVDKLKQLLLQQRRTFEQSMLSEEAALYDKIETLSKTSDDISKHIQEYISDISKLTYKKRWYKGSVFVAKRMLDVSARIDIQGLENIPHKGPCILAPRHFHSGYYPLLLLAVIPRPVIFITSVDVFINYMFMDFILYNAGALPYKPDDRKFGGRRPNRQWRVKRIEKFPSSNVETIRKAFLHLKHGDAVVIYPEGDSQNRPNYFHEGEFLKPLPGYVEMAVMAEKRFGIKVPIVPIGFKPKKMLVRYDITMRIGKPILLPDGLSEKNGEQTRKVVDEYVESIFSEVRKLSA